MILCLEVKRVPKYKVLKNIDVCLLCKSNQKCERIFFARVPTLESSFIVQREPPFTQRLCVSDLPPLCKFNNEAAQVWKALLKPCSDDTVPWHIWCLEQDLRPEEHPNSPEGFGLTRWAQRPQGQHSLSSHWFYPKNVTALFSNQMFVYLSITEIESTTSLTYCSYSWGKFANRI